MSEEVKLICLLEKGVLFADMKNLMTEVNNLFLFPSKYSVHSTEISKNEVIRLNTQNWNPEHSVFTMHNLQNN